MGTILITVDALRADHLSQYGYERDTMPVLDELAEGGTVFKQAFSNAPYTRISIPAIQTSRYLAYDNLERLPTLGSILSEQGIQTAIVGTQTGIGLVDGEFKYDETVDLGRDEFHDRANESRPLTERIGRKVDRVAESVGNVLRRYNGERILTVLQKPYEMVNPRGGFRYLGYTSAEEVTDHAIEWLNENAEHDFFLWIHYMEAHRPFGIHDQSSKYTDPPISEDEMRNLLKKARFYPDKISFDEHQKIIDLYDSDIRYCSRHLRRLFEYLRESGAWDSVNLIFSSDHGEEFNEHGMYNHRNYPYEELIHVPLIVKTAEGSPQAIDEERELVDIAPTILDFHGIDTEPYNLEGKNLFEKNPRDVIVLGQPADHEPAVTLRRYPWKYIFSETNVYLYNLEQDPDEKRNLISERDDIASRLRGAIPEYIKTRKIKKIRDPEDKVDRQQLAALGYLDE